MRKRFVMLASSLLGLAMVMGSASPAFARNNCERKVIRAEQKLRDAERKHGPRSRQAEQRRRDVENARARCRY